jgi:methionyl-tRNA formyltransferase
MNIAFLGDGPWAHKALTDIIEQGYAVKLVVVRFDARDPVLIELGNKNGIEVKWFKDVNSSEVLEYFSSLKLDIGVSMSFNQILKSTLINLLPYGFINCHAGKLPLYRGRNILNWALINDEKEIGVTCHYINEGVDTGDIIYQEIFHVSDTDDYLTVLNAAIDLCPIVLLKALNSIRDKTANVTPQPIEGTYFPARKDGDEFIDWNWSSRKVFNFVRAITYPGPYARTWLEIKNKHKMVFIKKVRMVPNATDYITTAGCVIGRFNKNIMVKTGDSYIEVLEYEIADVEKKSLNIGDRLGINWNKLIALLPL